MHVYHLIRFKFLLTLSQLSSLSSNLKYSNFFSDPDEIKLLLMEGLSYSLAHSSHKS